MQTLDIKTRRSCVESTDRAWPVACRTSSLPVARLPVLLVSIALATTVNKLRHNVYSSPLPNAPLSRLLLTLRGAPRMRRYLNTRSCYRSLLEGSTRWSPVGLCLHLTKTPQLQQRAMDEDEKTLMYQVFVLNTPQFFQLQ